jgi:hypothetical protein
MMIIIIIGKLKEVSCVGTQSRAFEISNPEITAARNKYICMWISEYLCITVYVYISVFY